MNSPLYYSSVFPLNWSESEQDPDNLYSQHLYTNEVLLETLGTVDSIHSMDTGDEHAVVLQELGRLDNKITLLMNMVGKLIASRESCAVAVPVKLNTQRIIWLEKEQPPIVGMNVEIRMCLASGYPIPLVMAAEIKECNEAKDHSVEVIAEWRAIPSILEDEIGKMVFRQHRRTIAESRRHQGGTPTD